MKIGTGDTLDWKVYIGDSYVYLVAADTQSGCYANDASLFEISSVPAHYFAFVTAVADTCPGGVEQLRLEGYIVPGIWGSSNPSVAAISTTGNITAIGPGTTNITCTLSPTCVSTQVLNIGTHAPSVAPITGPSFVCPGSAITMSTGTIGGLWSSSNPAIATISSTGVVTGISSGTVMISYTKSNDCAANAISRLINVGPDLDDISGPSGICVGSTATLTESVPGGTWSSSNPSLITIDPSTGVINGLMVGSAHITYTYTGGCGTSYVTRLQEVHGAADAGSITGPAVVCAGASATLSCSGSSGVWVSGNTGIATVNCCGLINGISGGAVVISYIATNSCGTDTAIKNLTVNSLPDPGTVTMPASICTGATTVPGYTVPGGTWSSLHTAVASVSPGGTLTASGTGRTVIRYSVANTCGMAFTEKELFVVAAPNPGTIIGMNTICTGVAAGVSFIGPAGTWSSSNSSVLVVLSWGILSGISAGTATVSYTIANACGMATATKVMTVNGTVSVATITGSGSICSGSNTTLSDATPGGFWSSANTAVATVSQAGVVTGITSGTAQISYVIDNGCSTAIATRVVVVVAPASAGSITGAGTVCAGAATTLASTAPGGVWSSGSPGIATVNGAGVVTGITAGTANISYSVTNTCGTARATKVMTVNGTAFAAPIIGSGTVCVGSAATVSDATAGGTWSTGNTSIAIVNAAGVLTGVAPGTTLVSYTVNNGCSTTIATRILSVNPLPVGGSVTGGSMVCVGSAITLTSSVTGGSWSSSGTGIATVNSGGVVTGVSVGTVNISYVVANSCGVAVATKSVTASNGPVVPAISGTSGVCVGSSSTLANTTGGGVWTSVFPSVATVNATGTVTGIAVGTATISYALSDACGSNAATIIITVNSMPVAASVSGSSSLCAGNTATLSGSIPGGLWSSSNSSFASVNSSGIVAGIAAGTVTISYTTSNSCGAAVATKVITVNSTTSAGAIAGASSVSVGATATLTSSLPGGNWSASNTNASIGMATGIVSGVSTGVVTISYTISSSCGTATTTKVMTVSAPLPTISGSLNTCVGAASTLSASVPGGVWNSSATSVAFISSAGVVTGMSAGTSLISYMLGGAVVVSIVTVNAQPQAITGTTIGCVGSSFTLASATNGGVWSSSNAAIATVSSGGVVTGISAGAAIISYALSSGCARTIAISIGGPASAIGGSSQVCVGSTTVLTNVPGLSWTSSNPAVATISTTSGLVTGISAGTTIITFRLNAGCYTSTLLSVNPLPAAIGGLAKVCIGATTTLSNTSTGGVWSTSNALYATVGASSGIVTGMAYTASPLPLITYTLPTGCYKTIAVTLNQSPSITGTTTVCPGSAVTLTGIGGGGSWSSSNTAVATAAAVSGNSGRIAGITSGTTSISYIFSTTGCSAITVVAVSAGPLPGVIAATPGFVINKVSAPTSTTLSSSGTAGGSWTSSNSSVASVNSSTGVVSAINAGIATITYTVAGSGCVATATHTVSVTAMRQGSSVAAGEQEQAVLVYPNPNKGTLYIVAPAEGVVTIWSVDGSEVAHYSVGRATSELFLPEGIAAGIYLCKYTGADGQAAIIRLVYEP